MQAVIFDLDGVLVDSEPNYLEAERRLLAEYGVEFTQEMKRPYIADELQGDARRCRPPIWHP